MNDEEMIVYVDVKSRLRSAEAFETWVRADLGVNGARELAMLNGKALWRSQPSQTGIEP